MDKQRHRHYEHKYSEHPIKCQTYINKHIYKCCAFICKCIRCSHMPYITVTVAHRLSLIPFHLGRLAFDFPIKSACPSHSPSSFPCFSLTVGILWYQAKWCQVPSYTTVKILISGLHGIAYLRTLSFLPLFQPCCLSFSPSILPSTSISLYLSLPLPPSLHLSLLFSLSLPLFYHCISFTSLFSYCHQQMSLRAACLSFWPFMSACAQFSAPLFGC